MAVRRQKVSETRARSRLSRGLQIALVVAFVGVAAWVVLRSGLFALETINVVGAQKVSIELALEKEGILVGQPLATVNTGGLAEEISLDPWVKSVSVVQEWPHQLTIILEEREAAAVVETPDGWWLISIDGVLLEPRGGRDEATATILWPGTLEGGSTDRALMTAAEFSAALREEFRGGAVIFVGEEGLEGSVMGFRVRIGSSSEGKEKALALGAVLDRNPEPGSTISVVAPSRPAVRLPDSD